MKIIAIASIAALLLSSDLPAANAAGDGATFWLDQVDLKALKQRRRVPLANLAVGGGKIVMDGKTYERGIGTRSISELVLDLHGEGTQVRHLFIARPEDLRRLPGQLSARSTGCGDVRALGHRLPQISLVLIRRRREGPFARRAQEAVSDHGRRAGRAEPRHRVQPVPVRLWRCLEMGRRSRRAHVAQTGDLLTIAVALFNRGLESHRIEARWSDLGIKGAQPVRNLWERRDLGSFDGSYAIEVPSHGAVMLKIGRAK